jgi:anaerobic selenocysteine-containing dehydrogenase
MYGRKLVEPPGECRSNHDVLAEIASRVGAEHLGFRMSPRQIIDQTLGDSKRRGIDDLDAENWFDVQTDFETSHFLNGFGHPDGKYHFKADWKNAHVLLSKMGSLGPVENMSAFPDHYAAHEQADETYPFRLATSPARTFLNSTFNETPGSLKREGEPTVLVHPGDLAALGLADGDTVCLGSRRGEVILRAKTFDGLQRGTLIAEGIWPNDAHADGKGINTLTGSDQPAPAGGGAFHDNAVWIRKAH